MRVTYTNLVILLIALTIFGYPLVAIAATIASVDSQILSLPFRGIIVAISLLLIFSKNQYINIFRIDNLLAFFFIIYTVRLIWDYNAENVGGADFAITFFIAVVLLPTLAVTSRAHMIDETRLRHSLMFFGLAFTTALLIARSVGLAYNPWAEYDYQIDRLMFEALNPITIGRVASVLVLVGVLELFQSEKRSLGRGIAIASIAIGVFSVILANSRGPIVAFMIALLYMTMSRPRILIVVIAAIGAFILFGGIQHDLLQNISNRFSILAGSTDASTEWRIHLMFSGWQAFLESPIFGAYFIDPNYGLGFYPHNLFIESAMALGIVGLAVFTLLNMRLVFNVVFRERHYHPTVNVLAIFFLGTVLFSGSLWGSSEYFMFLALSLALTKFRKQKLWWHGHVPADPRVWRQ